MSAIKDRGQIIFGWWQEDIANRNSGRARALAARLRRAGPIEALAEPEVHELAGRLGLWQGQAPGLVRLVQVLAEVRKASTAPLAKQLGGNEPALSNLRFQRLLRARGEDLTTALRRALPMVDRTCNVEQLGWDLLAWDHEEQGDRARVRWAFDYFAKSGTDNEPAVSDIPPENHA